MRTRSRTRRRRLLSRFVAASATAVAALVLSLQLTKAADPATAPSAPAGAPAPATRPETAPAWGTHVVMQETVLRRVANGQVILDTVDAGTEVVVIGGAGAEFRRVQTRDGRIGDVSAVEGAARFISQP
jgi:hypothetical protein